MDAGARRRSLIMQRRSIIANLRPPPDDLPRKEPSEEELEDGPMMGQSASKKDSNDVHSSILEKCANANGQMDQYSVSKESISAHD